MSQESPYKKHINYSYYKKHILLNNYLKNENRDSEIFNRTRNYIPEFQKSLKDFNIENYITSGYAIQLYLEDNKNINKKIINTYDIDLVLFYKNKELNNNGIIINLLKIVDSAIKNITNEKVINLYTVIKFEDINNNNEISNIIKNAGYHLYKYEPDKNNNMYKLYFVKIINKVYIKIRLKISNIDNLLIHNFYSYNLLKIYTIENNKKKNNYLPIDILIAKKNIKTESITTTINKFNKTYYIYNLKFIIYNLMNLYHNYVTLNERTLGKIKEGKNKRDYERLYYVLELYLKEHFKKNNSDLLKNIFSELKLNYKKYKTPTFKVNNKKINLIDEIINKFI
jgi:hypothetical protein